MADILDELEARYAVPTAPKCPVCGELTRVQAADAVRVTFGCEVKPFDIEHYELSRREFFRGDADVLALIARVRAAEGAVLDMRAATHQQFRVRWVAAPRPPAQPNRMEGVQTFPTFERAVNFLARSPSDTELVSVTEITSYSTDLTEQVAAAIRALPTPPETKP